MSPDTSLRSLRTDCGNLWRPLVALFMAAGLGRLAGRSPVPPPPHASRRSRVRSRFVSRRSVIYSKEKKEKKSFFRIAPISPSA